MAEEFIESEVVFPQQHYPGEMVMGAAVKEKKQKQKQKKNCDEKKVKNSMPMNIPERMVKEWGCDVEEEIDEEEMTPPHEILRRRVSRKMAFSVCTGNGRTLKGRDLSQVRNSILRLTGFLEA